jgi:5-methylcytosine-specific restriction endonuclease McrA
MIGMQELDRVLFLISWWLAAIKSHNAIGFFDINKVAEGVALKLLNEIYNFQLENLNYEKNNYPGIDLGDKANKVGFQITSRKDVRKIRENLGKFVKWPNKIYSNGIRFLILNQEKKPQLNKEMYQEICPNFDPEKHILNADDLIEEISRIYDSDRDKFYRIKEILEVEIAGKAMKRENKSTKPENGSNAFEQDFTSSIPKSIRFDVFKRDLFTCQYCGRQVPQVLLDIDYLIPQAEGGTAVPNNLVTACVDCKKDNGVVPLNIGKIKNTRKQKIIAIQEKKLQIEEYEKFILDKKQREKQEIDEINSYWTELCDGEYSLNENGLETIKKFLAKMTSSEIKEAIEICATRISVDEIESRFK